MAGRRIVAIAAGALLAVAGAGYPELGVRAARASCVTWNGGQVCDSPTSRPTWHAPSRVYHGGGGGGYRSYGGGGGGRAAAAIGAAGAAIGILGMMIDAAEQAEAAERNAANEAARRRWAACQGRYKRAHAMNEDARRMIADGETESGYAAFERAIATLGDCAAGADLAKLRNNLDVARREYAALTTPSEGRQYGGGAPKTNLPYPSELESRASSRCTHLPQNSPPWQSCLQNAEAEIAIGADDAIREACQSIANIAARNNCVFDRYAAAVTGQKPDGADNDNCYWDERGRQCHPGGRAANPPPGRAADDDPNSLRNQLKRALAEKPNDDAAIRAARAAEIARAKALRDSLPPDSPDRKTLDDVIAKAEAGQVPASPPPAAPITGTPAQQAAAPEPAAPSAGPGASTRDDAYENYMNSGNANSGGRNNGDLGRSGFSMSGSETRREIDRLLGQ